MKKGGCIDCKYHFSEIFFVGDEMVSDSNCDFGNTEAHTNWWKENGKKKREEISSIECFQETDSSKSLTNMSNILDRINSILDKNN